MNDFFWTWATQYYKEENLFYVRLEKMESGSCETLFQLDYGRFKTFKEAMDYIETLPEPEAAAWQERQMFG